MTKEKQSDWEKDFNKKITFPFPIGKYKGWGIEPSQIIAIKSFISALLQQEREKILKEVEQIMRDTLSADTLKAHNEVDAMYFKLDELRKNRGKKL